MIKISLDSSDESEDTDYQRDDRQTLLFKISIFKLILVINKIYSISSFINYKK